MNAEERCQLAGEVYECFVAKTESLEDYKIGACLAYLMGAIVQGELQGYVLYTDLPSYSDFKTILKENFSSDHAVWKFILCERWNG